jgi:hypothetical protein
MSASSGAVTVSVSAAGNWVRIISASKLAGTAARLDDVAAWPVAPDVEAGAVSAATALLSKAASPPLFLSIGIRPAGGGAVKA